MTLRRYEQGDAAVRFRDRDRKTTFRQTDKRTVDHGDESVPVCNEHRIVAPTIQIRTLKGCGLTQGKSPEYPYKDKELMNLKEEKVRISIHLSEKEKLERCAALCGISQNEFIRQFCKGKTPKPKPSKEFWEMLNNLYEVHNSFQKYAKYEPSTLEICKEIECLILDLQEAV